MFATAISRAVEHARTRVSMPHMFPAGASGKPTAPTGLVFRVPPDEAGARVRRIMRIAGSVQAASNEKGLCQGMGM